MATDFLLWAGKPPTASIPACGARPCSNQRYDVQGCREVSTRCAASGQHHPFIRGVAAGSWSTPTNTAHRQYRTEIGRRLGEADRRPLTAPRSLWRHSGRATADRQRQVQISASHGGGDQGEQSGRCTADAPPAEGRDATLPSTQRRSVWPSAGMARGPLNLLAGRLGEGGPSLVLDGVPFAAQNCRRDTGGKRR